MAKFICKNCNYKFDAEAPTECGFCGMNSIEKEKLAEELLEEVENLLSN